MGILNRIINYSVPENWDADKKRKYKQVNAFNLFLAFISVTEIIPGIIFKLPLAVVLETTMVFVFGSGFFFIKNNKLATARYIGIYGLEINMLALSILTVYKTSYLVPSYSSALLITYTIFPVVAALFDMKVFRHFLIAALFIILIQLIAPIYLQSGTQLIELAQNELAFIVSMFYSLAILSVLVYWVYNENRIVKDFELKRSKELQIALQKLTEKNGEIEKQKEYLEELDATKNKFFSIISHDLKSPFNAILGLSELLTSRMNKEEPSSEIANQIHKSAESLYELLENLLEWSRSQLNHIKFHPGTISLRKISAEVAETYSDWTADKQIVINNNIPEQLDIVADEYQLKTVIRNLLSNAIKFSWQGGEITFNADTDDKNVCFSITDKGTGIMEKEIDNLFRIESKSTSIEGTKNEKGSGLGLILCHEFIKNHGGKIWVESKEGKGSTFYFTVSKKINNEE